MTTFLENMSQNTTLASTYAYVHAGLYPQYVSAFETRCHMLNNQTLAPLPSQASNQAALASYFNTLDNLWVGMTSLMSIYQASTDPLAQHIYAVWMASASLFL